MSDERYYEAAWGALFAHYYVAAVKHESHIDPSEEGFMDLVRASKRRCCYSAATLAGEAIGALRALDAEGTSVRCERP